MTTVASILKQAIAMITPVSTSPQLDAELLLADVLQINRAQLHARPERVISESAAERFFAFIQRRQRGEPIAYLLSHQEFWSLDLLVTPDVLIPRPETELLVELVLQQVTEKNAMIADLGTGSGAIALAIAREKPHWHIHATDQSNAALTIARENAQRLQLSNVTFHQGTWCNALPPHLFHAIVSNPPYIAENDRHLQDLSFEPMSALIAQEDGLADIKEIINTAKTHLLPGGKLLLEHGFTQAENVINIFAQEGYNSTYTYRDLAGLERVTISTWTGF